MHAIHGPERMPWRAILQHELSRKAVGARGAAPLRFAIIRIARSTLLHELDNDREGRSSVARSPIVEEDHKVSRVNCTVTREVAGMERVRPPMAEKLR